MPKETEETPLLHGAAAVGIREQRHDATPQLEVWDTEASSSMQALANVNRGRRRTRFAQPARIALVLISAVAIGYVFTSRTLLQQQEEEWTPRNSKSEVQESGDGTQQVLTAQEVQGSNRHDFVPAERTVSDARYSERETEGERREPQQEDDLRAGWRSMAREQQQPGVSMQAGKLFDGVGNGEEKASKPNVFFFMIDDMGFGDIGYQSTDLAKLTPNLDALAAGGIKLSNYYSLSLCTPARASFLTGRYPVRLGMQYNVLVAGAPWGLPLDEKLLPEYMNDAGYESHMVGKWHLGGHNDESLPNRRGFQTYMGYLTGEETYCSHKNIEASLDGKLFYDFGFGNETDYYDITKTTDGIACSGPALKPGGMDEEEYLDALMVAESPADLCYTGTYSTDAFISRARQIVNQKTPVDEEPLFLYMAHQSVHVPLGPAPLEGFTEAEIDVLEEAQGLSEDDERHKFAGVLMYLDKRFGQFMDYLEKGGWLENAVVIVASDNGGCPDNGACNYPLRGSKQSMFEGGTRVPAFVWSKSHLPEDRWGTTYENMIHVTDWLPTIASAVGGTISGSAGALDGIDHWNSLTSVNDAADGDGAEGPRTEMLYNFDAYILNSKTTLTENFDRAQGAFRQGNWKLLMNAFCSGYYSPDLRLSKTDPLLDPKTVCTSTLECVDCTGSCEDDSSYAFSDMLFDVSKDPREAENLIEEFPEVAEQLRKRAHEVISSEYMPSNSKDVDTDSYLVWAANEWWMLPWVDKLPVEK